MLSIVITIFNDAESILPLIQSVLKTISPLKLQYELVLVDDNSNDNSREIISSICLDNINIKGIFLSRNYGQQIAMSAGINSAVGDYIVIMDGDLQNPPEKIIDLYHEASKGFDIVYCISKTRNGLLDKLTSKLIWLILKLLKVNIIPNQIMMRIFSKKAVKQFQKYREINRTIAGINFDMGMKYSTIHVINNRRIYGKSHYSLLKRLNIAIDFILDLTIAPLNILIFIGLISFALSSALILRYMYYYFTIGLQPGFTSIIVLLLFFGSINLIIFGILGRYLANIYIETRMRPLYLIDKQINL